MNINVEGYKVRKWFEFFEESAVNEMGVETDGKPIAKFVVGVVIQNPYASRFSQDLSLLTDPSCWLGDAFGRRLIRAANGYPIKSYGKSCLVGVSGGGFSSRNGEGGGSARMNFILGLGHPIQYWVLYWVWTQYDPI